MWVAVWEREIARRRSTSTSACAPSPVVTSPERTTAWWTTSPVTGDWTSRTSTRAPLSSSMTPWSAS